MPNTPEGAMSKQQRSETMQEYIILIEGSIEFINEEISNFNFEKYLKE